MIFDGGHSNCDRRFLMSAVLGCRGRPYTLNFRKNGSAAFGATPACVVSCAAHVSALLAAACAADAIIPASGDARVNGYRRPYPGIMYLLVCRLLSRAIAFRPSCVPALLCPNHLFAEPSCRMRTRRGRRRWGGVRTGLRASAFWRAERSSRSLDDFAPGAHFPAAERVAQTVPTLALRGVAVPISQPSGTGYLPGPELFNWHLPIAHTLQLGVVGPG